MSIIQDLQNDINNLKKGIDKKWLEEHVKHLKDPGYRVDGFGFLHDLHAADYIWTEEEMRKNKELMGITGLNHDLDVPKKLHVIAVTLNTKFKNPPIKQDPLVETCSKAISDSLDTMPWEELGEETYDGLTYNLKRLRDECRKHVKEAEKYYNLIIKNLADELKNVTEETQSDETMGRSVSLLYETWGVRDLGKLWGKWEKTFRGLINGIKLKPAEKQKVDKEPDAEEE